MHDWCRNRTDDEYVERLLIFRRHDFFSCIHLQQQQTEAGQEELHERHHDEEERCTTEERTTTKHRASAAAGGTDARPSPTAGPITLAGVRH
jgi:hypothetical protein